MKRLSLFLISLLMVVSTQAQKVVENDSLYADTRYGELLLNRGQLIKFVDSNSTSLRFGIMEPEIYTQNRSVYINEQKSGYFFKLSLKVSNVTFQTFIWYQDVDEIIKAIHRLKDSVEKDCESMPEYINNYYKTKDGFEIGYIVKKKGKKAKSNWYMSWKYYAQEIDIDIDMMLLTFQTAQKQIGEMIQRDRASYELIKFSD